MFKDTENEKKEQTKTTGAENRSLLDQFKHVRPEGGLPVYKFTSVGDAIVARFIGRRKGIKTKLGTATALEVDIIECSDGSTVGPHSIFESGHLTKIFDTHELSPGDPFYLRLYEIDRTTKYKRYAFKRIRDDEAFVGTP